MKGLANLGKPYILWDFKWDFKGLNIFCTCVQDFFEEIHCNTPNLFKDKLLLSVFSTKGHIEIRLSFVGTWNTLAWFWRA